MRTTVNGVQIAFTDEGPHGVAPILLVHGFPLSRGAWSRQVEAFGGSRRVIAPDLRGFGESEASPDAGPTSMFRFAEDLRALLLDLEVDSVILVGHSMGGYVAIAFAKAYPELLKGLVLVGTRAGADTPEAATGRRATAEKIKTEGTVGLVTGMVPKMLAPGNNDAAMIESVRALMAPSTPAGVIGALLGMADRPDARESLSQIKVPTLVIAGTEDTLIPFSESEEMTKAIPGADLRLISGAGHLVAFERAEAFNAALRDWLVTRSET